MSGEMRWYKRDPDAAMAGMIGMSLQERGAYNTILDLLYSRDGNVPNDDQYLQAAMGCHGNEWRAVKKKLLDRGKIWVTPDDKLMAKRVETALKEAGNFSETQRNRVGKRWDKYKNINNNNDHSIPKAGNTNTTTTTTTIKDSPTESPKSGSRLARYWTPSADDRAFAQSLGLRADAVAANFTDYWTSQPGAKGRKLNWSATWRIWCRKEAESKPKVNGHKLSTTSNGHAITGHAYGSREWWERVKNQRGYLSPEDHAKFDAMYGGAK